MTTAHGMVSRSSWWDAPQHWVLCTCGELIKGDSMESTAQSWRNHGGMRPGECELCPFRGLGYCYPVDSCLRADVHAPTTGRGKS